MISGMGFSGGKGNSFGGGGRGGGRGGGAGGGRGAGMGRGMGGGNRAGAGPAGECVCQSCGERIAHGAGVPCYSLKCPKCGSKMMRA